MSESSGQTDAASRRYISSSTISAQSANGPARLEKSAFFAGRSQRFLDALLAEVSVTLFAPGDIIMREGDYGDNMYFLQHGEVEVLSGPQMQKVASLPTGTVFGEMALLGVSRRRAATIRAVELSDCRELDGKAFRFILRKFPAEQRHFQEIARQRKEELNMHEDKPPRVAKGSARRAERIPPAKDLAPQPHGASEAAEADVERPCRSRARARTAVEEREERDASPKEHEARSPRRPVRRVTFQSEPAMGSAKEESYAPMEDAKDQLPRESPLSSFGLPNSEIIASEKEVMPLSRDATEASAAKNCQVQAGMPSSGTWAEARRCQARESQPRTFPRLLGQIANVSPGGQERKKAQTASSEVRNDRRVRSTGTFPKSARESRLSAVRHSLLL
mmetsp:Transcript_15333/g.33663  ORF Transcript_15333/g.33663 Transcript_15333/m.33663 type:complete len:391 (+) Transcript_15333:59-1231(+)